MSPAPIISIVFSMFIHRMCKNKIKIYAIHECTELTTCKQIVKEEVNQRTGSACCGPGTVLTFLHFS